MSHNTGRVGGTDPTHWHLETSSPVGQAPITSLRHLDPLSALHPAAAEMSGNTSPAHLAQVVGALPSSGRSAAGPATPHARLAPGAWGPVLQRHFSPGNPRGFCPSFYFGELLILSFPERRFPINPTRSPTPRRTPSGLSLLSHYPQCFVGSVLGRESEP